MARFTLSDLARSLNIKFVGDGKRQIDGIATLKDATQTDISFYSGKMRYREDLKRTKAAAVILASRDSQYCPVDMLITDNPYLDYARLSNFFGRHQHNARAWEQSSVHPSACIHNDANIHPEAIIGPHCCVGEHSCIGAGTVLSSHASVGRSSTIGRNCRIEAGVRIEDDVNIGDETAIHCNSVVGSDGFGYAWDAKTGTWTKIHQVGGVRIGAQVEIGALCTVNRGALADTIIEDGVKIDSQVHIAHNVRLGAGTIIAAGSKIGGSSVLGAGCRVSGFVCISNDLHIVSGVEIIAHSMVFQDIRKPGRYAGYPAYAVNDWRRNVAQQSQVHKLFARVSKLEKHTL